MLLLGCLFVSFRELECTVDAHCFCSLHPLSSFKSVIFARHVGVHKLAHIDVWTESSSAWFASCLFQSSRPVLHLGGGGEAFVMEALGVFLSRPVCFSDTQPSYLTCWWITQAVQSKFVFLYRERNVSEGTWCIPPHDNLSIFPLLWQCAWVWYSPLIPAAVGGEKSEACQAPNSQIWALAGLVDITTQSPPTFPHIPTDCLESSQPACSFFLFFFTASGSTN